MAAVTPALHSPTVVKATVNSPVSVTVTFLLVLNGSYDLIQHIQVGNLEDFALRRNLVLRWHLRSPRPASMAERSSLFTAHLVEVCDLTGVCLLISAVFMLLWSLVRFRRRSDRNLMSGSV